MTGTFIYISNCMYSVSCTSFVYFEVLCMYDIGSKCVGYLHTVFSKHESREGESLDARQPTMIPIFMRLCVLIIAIDKVLLLMIWVRWHR